VAGGEISAGDAARGLRARAGPKSGRGAAARCQPPASGQPKQPLEALGPGAHAAEPY